MILDEVLAITSFPMFEAVFFTVFTGFEDGGAFSAGNALSTTSPTTKSAVVF